MAGHVQNKHKVEQTTDTIWNFVKTKVRQT